MNPNKSHILKRPRAFRGHGAIWDYTSSLNDKDFREVSIL